MIWLALRQFRASGWSAVAGLVAVAAAVLATRPHFVEAAEAALQALEDELADPARWTDPHREAESSARHERARRELDDLYARWERALGRVEDAGGSE